MAKKLNKAIGKPGGFGTTVRSSNPKNIGKRGYVPAIPAKIRKRREEPRGNATSKLYVYQKGGSKKARGFRGDSGRTAKDPDEFKRSLDELYNFESRGITRYPYKPSNFKSKIPVDRRPKAKKLKPVQKDSLYDNAPMYTAKKDAAAAKKTAAGQLSKKQVGGIGTKASSPKGTATNSYGNSLFSSAFYKTDSQERGRQMKKANDVRGYKKKGGAKLPKAQNGSPVPINPIGPLKREKKNVYSNEEQKGRIRQQEEGKRLPKTKLVKKASNPVTQSVTPIKKHGGSHPGFKAVQSSIAKKQGISKQAAGAILASSTRKASPAAKRANPKLKRVKGK
jgi:hypothetical protein